MVVRPQLQDSSSKDASKHVPQGPRWQSIEQLCLPHFSNRPQGRVQMCSGS